AHRNDDDPKFLGASVPSAFTRAKKLRVVVVPVGTVVDVVPLLVVVTGVRSTSAVRALNKPARGILPALSTARADTREFELGWKGVSSVPFVFKRRILVRTLGVAAPIGCTLLKLPPTMRRPSDCRSITPTWPSMLGLYTESIVPLGLSRAMWFRVSP